MYQVINLVLSLHQFFPLLVIIMISTTAFFFVSSKWLKTTATLEKFVKRRFLAVATKKTAL